MPSTSFAEIHLNTMLLSKMGLVSAPWLWIKIQPQSEPGSQPAWAYLSPFLYKVIECCLLLAHYKAQIK